MADDPRPRPPLQKPVFCPRCDKPFLTQALLDEHISKHMDYVVEDDD